MNYDFIYFIFMQNISVIIFITSRQIFEFLHATDKIFALCIHKHLRGSVY